MKNFSNRVYFIRETKYIKVQNNGFNFLYVSDDEGNFYGDFRF